MPDGQGADVVDSMRTQDIFLDRNKSDGLSGLNIKKSVANGSANVSITNIAPAGVGTATISKWLALKIDGVIHYIPLWT